MKRTCLIVDDEPLALKVLESYIEQLPIARARRQMCKRFRSYADYEPKSNWYPVPGYQNAAAIGDRIFEKPAQPAKNYFYNCLQRIRRRSFRT